MAIKDFPLQITLNDTTATMRLMRPEDRNQIIGLAQTLPDEDLQFMRRDISRPEVVDEWVRDIQEDRTISLVVEDETQRIVGYGSLHHHQMFWSRHMGEIRASILTGHRNKGLGRRLVAELFLIAKEIGLEKVFVYIPADHRPVLMMVERLGFKAEALLSDWVKTRDERTHDLVIMSTSLAEF